MLDQNDFTSISIGLASPDRIKSWSHGEVKKPETINYRTQRPERDGLFCEKIFGPTKDWECYCSKYKKERFKGIICDRCGVEITRSKVRRERMGHVQLAAPVAHIWYVKGVPSPISILLDISPKNLEKVLYFATYIVYYLDEKRLEKKIPDIKKAVEKKIEELEKETSGEESVKIEELREGLKLFLRLEKGSIVGEKEYRIFQEIETLLEEKNIITEKQPIFKIGMGAECIRELLKEINLEKMIKKLRKEVKESSTQTKLKLIKKLEIVEAFYRSKNRPEWMILEVLPVIPPDLRPMVQLGGGRFATSDLNDLYRRVINRNNRLKRLIELGAPEIIIRNEKRMLQEAVDALFDNGKRGVPVTTSSKRPLKSLSDLLRGKHGRFRQNLLGKRVDYSGRSVIVVGPHLKIYQCGLPKEMALELFKPFVMKKLVDKGCAYNIKNAKRMIEQVKPEVWDVLEEIIKGYPVLLNRAPTLHRLGIQSFEPILIEGKAIQIHPLVCAAFNADFDGDQMAVHIPLSIASQTEARFLMLSSYNLLSPANGKPLATPTQDMVLGCYYLTLESGKDKEGEIKGAFVNSNEVLMAYNLGIIDLHSRIKLLLDKEKIFVEKKDRKEIVCKRFENISSELLNWKLAKDIVHPKTKEVILHAGKKITERNISLIEESQVRQIELIDEVKGEKIFASCGYLETTVGRVIFNESLPEGMPFIDKVIDKEELQSLVNRCYKDFGLKVTVPFLDKLKELGFKYATKSGITIGIDDMEIPTEKEEILTKSDKEVEKVEQQFQRNLITEEERYQKVIDIWTKTTDELTDKLLQNMDDFNPVYMMANSGARGAVMQIRQIAGMRGLTIDPSGKIIDVPIKSSLREGLTVLEYFIATHGQRKGLADTALRTADAGYLTRRLADIVQDIVITEENCGTTQGIKVSKFTEGEEVIEELRERIVGRFSAQNIINPKTEEIILKAHHEITEEIADEINKCGIEEVKIRSILTCQSKHGICATCYGRNLSTGQKVEVGEAVGIIAAQSIGEPGTQLTLRTFHTGGMHGMDIPDITQGLPRVEELFESRKPKGQAIISEIEGTVKITEVDGKITISIQNEKNEKKDYTIPHGAKIKVNNGQKIEIGDQLTVGSINPHDILKIKGTQAVQNYLIKEVQKVYKSQGVSINDKHIEVIVRRLLRWVKIEDAGDTRFLPGQLIEISEFKEENQKVQTKGGKPAKAKPQLLGITRASLATDSFLSAASFQETTKVLAESAIRGKHDRLLGLKENVIIGKLIPAGTGMKRFRSLMVDMEGEE